MGLTIFDASEEDGTKAQPLYEHLAFDRLESIHSGEGSLEFEDAEPHPPAERLRDAVVPLGQEDTEYHPGDDGHTLRETSEEGDGDFPQPSFDIMSVVHGMGIIRGLNANRCRRKKMI